MTRKKQELTIPLSAFSPSISSQFTTVLISLKQNRRFKKQTKKLIVREKNHISYLCLCRGSHSCIQTGPHSVHTFSTPSFSSRSAQKQTPPCSTTFIFCQSLVLPHLRSWAFFVYPGCTLSSSVSILLLFSCLFIHKLPSLDFYYC